MRDSNGRASDGTDGGRNDAGTDDAVPQEPPEPPEPLEPLEPESDEERAPSPDFPDVPGRDIGPGRTRDVDPPPNAEP